MGLIGGNQATSPVGGAYPGMLCDSGRGIKPLLQGDELRVNLFFVVFVPL